MSGYIVEIAPGAEGDIADAFLWYQERNALIADAFRPLARTADDEGNRKRVLNRLPYSVVYEVVGKTLTILAVAHHRREPAYWRASKGRPQRS